MALLPPTEDGHPNSIKYRRLLNYSSLPVARNSCLVKDFLRIPSGLIRRQTFHPPPTTHCNKPLYSPSPSSCPTRGPRFTSKAQIG
ncbi:hypothetical protein PGT21_014363 [Puccinia graminis f. sp. tritici]|uniref:Uncharacterized protein n=1 Tax=Puccinia graminis f. sp. tritici TaxID=56615 RepID=A0A5B0QU79_PUCGR|nr:hypothetical protein PGT21_014363 [Puccinia graminis f. sp. tritici]